MELKDILVVEDDADIRKILRISLENIGGFNVTLCASAHEALEKLQARQPDLLLLDVMMPVMDGPGLLREIRQSEKLKHIPAIFITGKVQSHELKEYMLMGVLGVISKPFEPLGLPAQLRELWQSVEMV